MGITESTEHVVAVTDFLVKVEAAGRYLPSPGPFVALEDDTKIALIESRICGTFAEGLELSSKARAEGWRYPAFRQELIDVCTPFLRQRLEAELRAMTLGVADDDHDFFRKLMCKLGAAYAAGVPTGAGNAVATAMLVEDLINITLAAKPTLGSTIWSAFQDSGGGQYWMQYARPLVDFLHKVVGLLRPPSTQAVATARRTGAGQTASGAASRQGAQLKAIADDVGTIELARQLGQAQAELRAAQAQLAAPGEVAQLYMSFGQVTRAIGERFTEEELPATLIMDRLGGRHKEIQPTCPLCDQKPHTEERFQLSGLRTDAWKACPKWIAREGSAVGAATTVSTGAASTYTTQRERSGQTALRQAQGMDASYEYADREGAGLLGNGE
jgi:hypothetical protein